MKYIASTIVRASDIGLNNNLFGGTLLRWLDEYGALFVYKYLKHKFVTYKMEKTYFLKSAKQGDCIDFYVTNLKFNSISVNFDLVAKINTYKPAKEIINTNMTFVAIDEFKEKPMRLNPMLFETDEFEKLVYQSIEKYMTNDDSIFHNIFHVKEMLNQLNMYKATFTPSIYKRIFFAICYHDVIHVPGDKENEEKSFETFNKTWGKILTNEDVTYIKNLILCTKTDMDYNEIKKYENGDLIHDLDMCSFINYETMVNNDVKIKTEYSNFSPLEFYEYKLKYFDRLITEGVFISDYFVKYNNVAIENIKKYSDVIKELITNMKNN